MKLLKDSTYDALVQRAEESTHEATRWKDIYGLEYDAFRNYRLASKFNFGSKIQRAVIGACGTGKTTFLKHIANQMPYKCKAFNFGQMQEFGLAEDKLAAEHFMTPESVDDIVKACLISPGLVHLIDNVAMFGIDEAKLIRELRRHGAEFIITSQSAPRIAAVEKCLDFVYHYPTVEKAIFMYPYVRMEARTLRPAELEENE